MSGSKPRRKKLNLELRPLPRALGRYLMVEALEDRTFLTATVIDVMVLYDDDALAQYAGSDALIQKAIGQSIDFANLAHLNTQDNVVLRLVHTEHLVYSSTVGGTPASEYTDLAALKANATANNLRAQYGADMVSMVDSSSEGGGLGDEMPSPGGDSTAAFNVVDVDAIGPGQSTMAHEFGHNMGAGHEQDNTTFFAAGVYSYSFGYHTAATFAQHASNGTDYGDVMSYQGATLPIFANPRVSHAGVPMGILSPNANAADLWLTFTQTAPVVAGYKSTIVADAAPTASLWQTDLSGDQLTFTVRYIDDIGINPATLDSSDVYVHTPEGFNLAAQFIGADQPGGAYAESATYRVTLPKSLPAVSSLSFFLNASQVTDTTGQAVASGQIANNGDGDQDAAFTYNNNAHLTTLALARDTGLLTPNSSRTLSNNLGIKFTTPNPNDPPHPFVHSQDAVDVYKFTLTQAAGISLAVTGLTTNANIFLVKDSDLNEVWDDVNEPYVAGAALTSSAGGGRLGYTAAAGTYYIYFQATTGQAASPYSLTISNVTGDTVGPGTPVLDQVDVNSSSTTVDLYVKFTDDQDIDVTSVSTKGYLKIFNPSGSGIIIAPVSVTGGGKSVVAHYNYNFGSSFPSGNVSVYVSDIAGFQCLVKDTAGNALTTPLGTLIGTYRVGTLPADGTAPTASIGSAPQLLVPTGTTYDFVITYKDNRGINTGTIDGSDIQVTGPNSFNQAATLVAGSVTTSPGGAFTSATYRITAPGGAWDYLDDGNYAIALNANQVKDLNNTNTAVAGSLGTFKVHIPQPGDADFDDTVGLNDLLLLANNYGLTGRGIQTGDFDYDGVVGLNDLLLLANHYGITIPTPGAPVPGDPVPGPTPGAALPGAAIAPDDTGSTPAAAPTDTTTDTPANTTANSTPAQDSATTDSTQSGSTIISPAGAIAPPAVIAADPPMDRPVYEGPAPAAGNGAPSAASPASAAPAPAIASAPVAVVVVASKPAGVVASRVISPTAKSKPAAKPLPQQTKPPVISPVGWAKPTSTKTPHKIFSETPVIRPKLQPPPLKKPAPLKR